MTRSDNAMRIEMDPPSDRPRVVSGPSQDTVTENREAVFEQAFAAYARGDNKHGDDLYERWRALA